MSRAMFSYLVPLVFKYYKSPITGPEVPALREDDASAASMGAWRAEQATIVAQDAKKQDGNADRRRHKLVWLLLWFFRRELAKQAVSLHSHSRSND